MAKVGIYKIGFVDLTVNSTNDTWTSEVGDSDERSEASTTQTPQQQQQTEQEAVTGITMLSRIDQSASSMHEKEETDDEGCHYLLELSTTVRNDADIAIAQRLACKPLVIHVWTVDGRHRSIGDESYPARIDIDDNYDGIASRGVTITSRYETLYGILA